MCNLYSVTTNQAAIRDLFKVGRDTTGNLPPLPAIFPDQLAPIVRGNEAMLSVQLPRPASNKKTPPGDQNGRGV